MLLVGNPLKPLMLDQDVHFTTIIWKVTLGTRLKFYKKTIELKKSKNNRKSNYLFLLIDRTAIMNY